MCQKRDYRQHIQKKISVFYLFIIKHCEKSQYNVVHIQLGLGIQTLTATDMLNIRNLNKIYFGPNIQQPSRNRQLIFQNTHSEVSSPHAWAIDTSCCFSIRNQITGQERQALPLRKHFCVETASKTSVTTTLNLKNWYKMVVVWTTTQLTLNQTEIKSDRTKTGDVCENQ